MTRREQTARLRFGRVQQALGVKCAQHRAGRILLHIAALCFDRQLTWHARGIFREFC